MGRARIAIALSGILIAGVAHATTIPAGGGGFGWVGLSGFTLNNNGTPYFDHTSGDGAPPGAIWPILNNQGIPDSRLQFWGTSGGGADTGILFDLTSGAESATFTLKFEFAANAPVNEFGWFAASDPTVLNPIFGGPDTPGATTPVLLPTGPYGFYLKNISNGNVFLSLSGSSPNDAGFQHFAVFQDTAYPGSLWIGVEDLGLESGDQDFNDLVVKVTGVTGSETAHAPEPGTLLLVGSGLVAAGVARRRARRLLPR